MARSIEEMHETYEALPPASRASYAGRVRAVCKRRGEAIPEWAAVPEPPPAPEAAKPIALAPELSAWRAAGERVVSRAADGQVTLYEWQGGRLFYARFPDEAAAASAIAAGAVEWTRKNRPATPSQSRTACAPAR